MGGTNFLTATSIKGYKKNLLFSVLPSRTNFLKGELGQLLKELDMTGRGDVHFRVAAGRLKNNADSIQVSQSLSYKVPDTRHH